MPTRTFALFLLPLVAGCFGVSHQMTITPVNWVEENIAVEDVTVDLGMLNDQPVARVTRGGNGAADAMVFCGYAQSPDGELIGSEAATVYEQFDGHDVPLFIAHDLPTSPPSEATAIRFRVVLPDVEPAWTGHISIPGK